MTKAYAWNMWKNYLKRMQKSDKERVIDNPIDQFYHNVTKGYYDTLNDEKYERIENNILDEGALFQHKNKATVYTLFIRGIRTISLTEDEINSIADTLADATARTQFRN